MVQIRLEEARVFEKNEQAEAQDDCGRHRHFSLPLAYPFPRHQPAADIVDHRRSQHQQNEPWIPPAVKNITRDEQPEVAPGCLVGQDVIDGQHNRQEIEDEKIGGENHG